MSITKRNSADGVKPSSYTAPAVIPAITYATTENLFGGTEPWPPDGDGFWVAIGSTAPGFTRWRHIGLVPPLFVSSTSAQSTGS